MGFKINYKLLVYFVFIHYFIPITSELLFTGYF